MDITMPITFITAHANDFDSLVALRIAAMRKSLEHVGRFDPMRATERFRESFVPSDTKHIEVEQKRIGFVVVKQRSEFLLLDHLYIHPNYQNQRIGETVLAHIFANADALKLPVRVGALRGSDSNRFYLRHGFQLVEQSEFDNYYVRPNC